MHQTVMSRTGRPVRDRDHRRSAASAIWLAFAAASCLAAAVANAAELGYRDYRAVMRACERLDHLACIESLEDENGPYIVIGDRFGLVRIIYLTGDGSRDIWTSKQLNGVVQEVIGADLDGDGKDEIIAWSTSAMVYVWSGADHKLRYETLQNEFQILHSLAVGNVDDDAQLEILVNADDHIYYLDGVTFNREWTSLREYQATRMAVGDVDGDGTPEIVLNTGQIVDARGGDVEWEDVVFGTRIELVDMDGDGIPEVLTESDGGLLKIYDVDIRREKHLQ
ncbi:hypothetical protein KKG45_03570 [bacterium]|nr:hypothetical protein [bacterium]MBU1072305.1 hypothetical protein [bacterium]MBU1675615.1 hypothetical protein [bacterium]